MDVKKEEQIKEYIDKNERTNKSILREAIIDLTGLKEKTEENLFTEWLKNDKDLLKYAELFNKKGQLTFGESFKFKMLGIKLAVTCPYFLDFKDFLEELQLGKDTSISDDSKQNDKETKIETAEGSKESATRTFCGININNIKSEPFERSGKNGITRCSKTARANGRNFNVNLPRGNAYDAGKEAGKNSIKTIPENKASGKPQNSWSGIDASSFESITKGNFADIYTNSKSNYGHRASAFKDDSGEWYVLDPYTRVNGKLDNSPKKLKEYLSVRKIVKAHIYESKGYKSMKASDSNESNTGNVEFIDERVEAAVEWALSTAGDDSFGYEWGGTGKKNNGKGGYDCQSFVRAAFIHAGFDVPPSGGCGSMRKDFEKVGFEWISPLNINDLQEGDILVDPEKHAELFAKKGKVAKNGEVVGANGEKDSKPGDSSGKEIYVKSIKNFLGYCKPTGILRYKG